MTYYRTYINNRMREDVTIVIYDAKAYGKNLEALKYHIAMFDVNKSSIDFFRTAKNGFPSPWKYGFRITKIRDSII